MSVSKKQRINLARNLRSRGIEERAVPEGSETADALAFLVEDSSAAKLVRNELVKEAFQQKYFLKHIVGTFLAHGIICQSLLNLMAGICQELFTIARNFIESSFLANWRQISQRCAFKNTEYIAQDAWSLV